MMFLSTRDSRVRERWQSGVSRFGQTYSIDSHKDLIEALKTQQPELVFLHLDLPGLNRLLGTEILRREYPAVHLFAFSNKPNDDEGLRLLRVGVRGYANTYMDPRLIAKATEVVRKGEIWVGRRLMARLIEDAARGSQQQIDSRVAHTLDVLTERQREIAVLVSRGASNKQIASALGIAERTVKVHLGSIFGKTGTKDRLQLALVVNGFPVEPN